MTLTRESGASLLDDFVVPGELEASGPPESRNLARDGVRLMVASDDGITHRRFTDLALLLDPGDLVVFNNSATLPAAVVVDDSMAIHFSTIQPEGLVVVEPRLPKGKASIPLQTVRPGRVRLPDAASIQLLAPYPLRSTHRRLWLAAFDGGAPLNDYLQRWGRPIRYSYVDDSYPIDAYKTVFATVPGSAEMPSAGRPFSERVVSSLVKAGVALAPVTLHTGVSSLETGEPPYPEWFEVPETTAALVNHTRSRSGRVVAVGTTVVRALETSVDRHGAVHSMRSWTDLVIAPDHCMGAVDGLITGWHEPRSTHLAMLEAVAGRAVLSESYRAALDHGYLWHEFGDSLLLLRR
ncbi:MAG: S-adenosylmethionine:tRNA ribosyltransferase-isomerase [Acidimicrobiia bacterium]